MGNLYTNKDNPTEISAKIAKLRIEYGDQPLNQDDLLLNPLDQFRRWFDDAIATEVKLAEAFALSTVYNGRPKSRFVLFKDIIHGNLVFYTHYDSAKAKEMTINSFVAGTFYWREIHRQVRFEGVVSKVPATVSDNYFNSRPRETKLSAIASHQSQVIADRISIEDKITALKKQYKSVDIPRPNFWGGYMITINYWEFWQGRASRTHDRFAYNQKEKDWHIDRLSP